MIVSPSPAGTMTVLVQCDLEETFYRFPGGTVEFGETAARAIARELLEEFDLVVSVGNLGLISEDLFEYGGRTHHQVTVLHHCTLVSPAALTDTLYHKESPDSKLVARTIEQLKARPIYPSGIISYLEEHDQTIRHLVDGFQAT